MSALAYQFAGCFGPSCPQDELFEGSGLKTLLDHILEGYSATAFAYGAAHFLPPQHLLPAKFNLETRQNLS